ncbi:MAG: class I SAM-dependent methyltransferase [Pseudomonadota bacterium]
METSEYELLAQKQATHWWYRVRRNILESLLEDHRATSDEPCSIIEIGAGAGSNVPVLKQFGTVTAVEMHDASRTHLERLYPDVSVGSAALPDSGVFRDAQYDVVVMFDVLEHVEQEHDALKVVKDHVKPKGRLLLTVPAYQWLWTSHDERMHHFRRYNRQMLRASLEDAGWTVERIGYFNTYLFPLAVLARLKDKVVGASVSTGSRVPNSTVNRLFYRVFQSELPRIRRGGFPFGLSVFAMATRQDPPQPEAVGASG